MDEFMLTLIMNNILNNSMGLVQLLVEYQCLHSVTLILEGGTVNDGSRVLYFAEVESASVPP